LFERWIEIKRPRVSTVDRWRAVFLRLKEDFGLRSATAIMPEEAQDWINGLINDERTPGTVRDVWRIAARTVFAWAVGHKLIPRNPFADVKVTVPRRVTTRETKAFRADEITTILKAALAITDTKRTSNAAKRRVPWILAYTGARVGEITQLRGADVIEQDGVSAIRITPEAGAVKTGRPRLVPLHDHLIEQGFVSFARANGKGPLFYNQPPQAKGAAADTTNPRKPRYVKARELLAAWVRGLGVSDPELQPNHAWRHSYKQIADRHGISERISDWITGHSPASVGRGYGTPTLEDMAAAIKRFPRYAV
jgi:integrase